MALETLTKLSTYTVGAGGDASITISNIPQTYTDLKIVISARTNRSAFADNIGIRFNGDTATNYAYRRLYGLASGSPGSSNSTAATYIIGGTATDSSATSNTFGSAEIYIPNYTGSAYKILTNEGVSENNATDAEADSIIGLWSSPANITSITFFPVNGTTFSQYSTLTVYGVKAARTAVGSSIKAVGGNVLFDGTYVYHVFNSTSSFTTMQPITADVLVVAGGGGGGAEANGGPTGGGGGAGGLRAFANQSYTSGLSITATVGAGGTGAPTSSTSRVNNGSNTSFGALAVSAGGGGGIYGSSSSLNSGAAGGSGGGSSQQGNNQTAVGGAGNAGGYSPVEGYAGGSSPTNLDGVAAGGGGAGGAGNNSTTATNAGKGGDGANSYNSFNFGAIVTAVGINTTGYLAGGGGGGGRSGTSYPGPGIGGAGGGGTGGLALNSSGSAGQAYTGSGGGGSAAGTGSGGNGGSGVIIVRYKA